jgi:hypothetical protein
VHLVDHYDLSAEPEHPHEKMLNVQSSEHGLVNGANGEGGK